MTRTAATHLPAWRRWGRSTASACLALLVAACSSLPPPDDRVVEPDVPAQWSQSPDAAGSAASDGWWQRFGDPLLPVLVAQALQSNTRIAAAQAALRQARALRDAAGSALQPGVGLAASVQHGSNTDSSAGTSSSGSARAGLDASWELDLFGGQRSALRAAESTLRASQASLGDVQVSLAAEVGLSYIALRAGQARLAVADDNLTSQLRTLQLTEWRVQAGLLSTQEAEQARSAAAQTRAQLPALRTGVTQTVHALAVLTGRPPADLMTLLAAPVALPQPDADLALSLPADTLRQRPDVRAAEQQVLAAQARVAQADAARWPSLSLGGSLGLQALALGSGGSTALVTSALASVKWPLWDGGAARAQVRVQQAAVDQARAAYRGAVLAALTEVEDALAALRGDRQRVLNLQQAVAAASRAATLAGYRFDGGLIDLQVVLETQRARLATQDSLASANADVSADHVRLFKALGGGWRPSMADEPALDPTPAMFTPRSPPISPPR